MEWHPVFRAGRTRIQVPFTGGHLCGGACTPASYETSDPVVQMVIERSAAFRQGRIRLVMEGGGEWRAEGGEGSVKSGEGRAEGGKGRAEGGEAMGGGHSDRRPVGPTAESGDSGAAVRMTASHNETAHEDTDCASGAAVRMTASNEMTASHEGCVFEYSKIDDISDFLQFNKEVPLERLCSDEACFKEAERLGVVLIKKERES